MRFSCGGFKLKPSLSNCRWRWRTIEIHGFDLQLFALGSQYELQLLSLVFRLLKAKTRFNLLVCLGSVAFSQPSLGPTLTNGTIRFLNSLASTHIQSNKTIGELIQMQGTNLGSE